MTRLEVCYYSQPVKNKRIDKYVINGYYKYDNMQIPIKKEGNQKVNVCFPDESFISIDYTYEGHPAFAIINESLRQFEFKEIRWTIKEISFSTHNNNKYDESYRQEPLL